jgi:hypothetical protein
VAQPRPPSDPALPAPPVDRRAAAAASVRSSASAVTSGPSLRSGALGRTGGIGANEWAVVALPRQECDVVAQARQFARQPVGVTWTVRRRPQSPQKRGGS